MNPGIAIAEFHRCDPAVSHSFDVLKLSTTIEVMDCGVLGLRFQKGPDVEALPYLILNATLPTRSAIRSGHPPIDSFLTHLGIFSQRPSRRIRRSP